MKHGLGKGLGALFSQFDNETMQKTTTTESASVKSSSHTNTEPMSLDMNKIYPNPNQPRKHFDAEALQELSDSIKVHGLIQPIIVNQMDDGYMIIAGERRYRACKLAGMTEISAIIKSYTDRQVSEIAIIENLQREDLNPVEVARGIKQLIEEYSLTQEKVGERLGKSRSAITNYIRLLSLETSIIAMIEANKISFGHAKCLVGVQDPGVQLYLAKQVSKNKLTVRGLEKEISKLKDKPEKAETKPGLTIEMAEFVNMMQRVLGTKVGIIGNTGKGRIYIDYYDKEDLERIHSILNKC